MSPSLGEVDLRSRPCDVCSPVVPVHRIFLVEVNLEESVVDVASEVLESVEKNFKLILRINKPEMFRK